MLASASVRTLLIAFLALSGCLLGSLAQATTAFTYQGQLVNQGTPANGVHDFSFELFDQDSGGSSLTSVVVVEDIMVTDGLFTTQIDFGTVFDGSASWLEVGVRDGNSSAAFSILNPRHQITPNPMALEADTLDGMQASDFASAADINALLAQINALQNQVNALSSPTLLGRSDQTSNGRFTFDGQNGLKAAHAMCQATFINESTAHACTLHEIQRAVAEGNVASTSISGNAHWLVAPHIRGSQFTNSMLQNSCQNLMYNSADLARGTRVIVRLNYQSPGNGGGVIGDVIDLQSEIACGTNMPVLCCR